MKNSFIISIFLFSLFSHAEGVDKEAIRLTVRKNLKDVRNCYELALEKDKALQGKVVLGWTVDKDGHVEKVKVIEGLNDNVDHCLVEKLKSWTFPKPPKGMKFEVDSYPFVFSSVEREK